MKNALFFKKKGKKHSVDFFSIQSCHCYFICFKQIKKSVHSFLSNTIFPHVCFCKAFSLYTYSDTYQIAKQSLTIIIILVSCTGIEYSRIHFCWFIIKIRKRKIIIVITMILISIIIVIVCNESYCCRHT